MATGLHAAEPQAGQAAADAVNHQAASLGRQFMARPGNSVFSPWSAQSALAMLWTGAAGETKKEMALALGLAGDAEVIVPSFKALRKTLTTGGPKEKAAIIQAASRIFLDRGYEPLPSWKETIRTGFGADAEQVPFDADGPAAAARINQWVQESTGGRITSLISPGASFPLTRLVVADAVYFDVPWAVPFDRAQTKLGKFFVSKDTTRQTSLMTTERELSYERKSGYQIVALRYAARELQFVALVPDKGDGLPGMVAQLTPQLIAGCTKMQPRLVSFTVPRLNLTLPAEDLRESLRQMGMPRALSPLKAEFPGISTARPPLYISSVRQRTWLVMDEDGTQAAAATEASAAPFGEPPAPPKPAIVRADRPFVFMIQHIPTGACLFMGRLSDPAR